MTVASLTHRANHATRLSEERVSKLTLTRTLFIYLEKSHSILNYLYSMRHSYADEKDYTAFEVQIK